MSKQQYRLSCLRRNWRAVGFTSGSLGRVSPSKLHKPVCPPLSRTPCCPVEYPKCRRSCGSASPWSCRCLGHSARISLPQVTVVSLRKQFSPTLPAYTILEPRWSRRVDRLPNRGSADLPSPLSAHAACPPTRPSRRVLFHTPRQSWCRLIWHSLVSLLAYCSQSTQSPKHGMQSHRDDNMGLNASQRPVAHTLTNYHDKHSFRRGLATRHAIRKMAASKHT